MLLYSAIVVQDSWSRKCLVFSISMTLNGCFSFADLTTSLIWDGTIAAINLFLFSIIAKSWLQGMKLCPETRKQHMRDLKCFMATKYNIATTSIWFFYCPAQLSQQISTCDLTYTDLNSQKQCLISAMASFGHDFNYLGEATCILIHIVQLARRHSIYFIKNLVFHFSKHTLISLAGLQLTFNVLNWR